MDYSALTGMATQGVAFFSNGQQYDIIISGGGVKVVHGVEVDVPEVRGKVTGVIRSVSSRDINGETIIAGDMRGIFDNSQEISKGMRIIYANETYNVVDPRPIRPTGTTVIAYRPILRRIAVGG